MVFNSYTFIIFLLAVFAFYFSGISWRAKKILLIVASYIFYAAWNPPFVLLIVFSTLIDWELSRRIYVARAASLKKWLVTLSLMTNLGLLGFFKYSTLAVKSFAVALQQFGIDYQPLALDIVLPVGISFYTFQTLSYTLDVYRGQLKPSNSFVDYALFVTFFPQLVAGPIVRARDFLPQMLTPRRPTGDQFGWGISLLIFGLFQKVAIADGLLAPVVEKVYDSTDVVSPLAAGVGTLAFAGQIFLDFAGYSTIAIGVAMCLGFALPDNFRFPYAAIGFSDFWKRWHISLSTWLRDYLYFSLGGNRSGNFKTYRNLMITMLLGGLWHGASWTFVIWGGLHGLYLVAERGAIAAVGSWAVWRTGPARFALAILTFGLVCLAWVFFRAHTFDKAFEIVQAGLFLLPARQIFVTSAEAVITITVLSVLMLLHWLLRETTLENAADRVPSSVRGVLLGLMLAAVALSPGEDRAFIYFQF